MRHHRHGANKLSKVFGPNISKPLAKGVKPLAKGLKRAGKYFCGLQLHTPPEAASPPPNSFCALFSRRDPPPPGESRWYLPNDDYELTMAVLPETQRKLGDFVLAAELWWEGRLVGASTGRLGSTFAVEDLSYCHRIEVGNLFGGRFTDVPSCFAHGTDTLDEAVPWEKLFLRLILCDATSFATQCIYEGTLIPNYDGLTFRASPILCFPAAGDDDGAADIEVYSYLDQVDLLDAAIDTHDDTTAPRRGASRSNLNA